MAKKSKKTKVEKSEKVSIARQLIEEWRQKGSKGIYVGSEIQDSFDQRLPSESLGINCITRGGIPYNAMTEIVGPPSSFKTTTAFGFCKQAQSIFKEDTVIVWMSRENMIDIKWSRHCGVKIPYSEKEIKELKTMMSPSKLDSLVQSQEDSGEFILLGNETPEEDFDRVHDLLYSGAISLYVLDSVGAVTPSNVLEASHREQFVAANPKLIGRHINLLHSISNKLANDKQKTAFLLINQVRAKIGGMPSRTQQFEYPGGYGLKHGKHLCLATKTVGFIRNKKNDVMAKQVSFRVDKSKVCIPHRSCTLTYIIRGDNPWGMPIGMDRYSEAVDLARDCGIIAYSGRRWEHKGKIITVVDLETGEEREATRDELPIALMQQSELFENIKTEVLEYHRNLEITGLPHNEVSVESDVNGFEALEEVGEEES